MKLKEINHLDSICKAMLAINSTIVLVGASKLIELKPSTFFALAVLLISLSFLATYAYWAPSIPKKERFKGSNNFAIIPIVGLISGLLGYIILVYSISEILVLILAASIIVANQIARSSISDET